MPEETPGKGLSPGKAPLFLPQARRSLDYARDDCALYSVIQSEAWNLLERTPICGEVCVELQFS